ncbi:MAG: hypothetical protein ACRC3H_06680 [Lachnospiraceae bacterium]
MERENTAELEYMRKQNEASREEIKVWEKKDHLTGIIENIKADEYGLFSSTLIGKCH